VFSAKPPFEQRALLETGPITNHVNFANNSNGKFAYVTIGGTNQVKVYQRGSSPTLVATIPVGDCRTAYGLPVMAHEFTSLWKMAPTRQRSIH
jgi:hypothetical protein